MFVWITFKRPNLDTNLDSRSVTNSDSRSVTNSDSRSVTNSVTLLLTDRQKEVLRYCMIERSSREILEHINVTYQFKNIKRFINELVDTGLLERTIPDSPNHPKQKYITKQEGIEQ